MLRNLLRKPVQRLSTHSRCKDGPIVARIRSRLERYADWLAEGDPEEVETLPAIYEGAIDEFKAVEKAIPESPEEEAYLEQRREDIYADVEADRLKYFDSLLGTNTYFRKVEAYEERVSVDTIMQRKQHRREAKVFEWRIQDVEVERNVKNPIKTFLKPNYEEIDQFETDVNLSLPAYPTSFTNEIGKREMDPFGYLDPKMITPGQIEQTMAYMFNQSVYFDSKIIDGNSVNERIHKDLEKAFKSSKFESELPIFGSKHVYYLDEEEVALWRVKKQFADLKNLKNSVKKFKENNGGGDVLPVYDKDEIREFFFNFGDATSFFLCRHLKNHEIELENIVDIQFCDKDKFLITTLSIGQKNVIFVKNMDDNTYLNMYFVNDDTTPFKIVYLDDESPQLVTMQADEFGKNKVVVKVNLVGEDKFISHKIDEEEITSVVRYMKKNKDKLINNEAQFSTQVKEFHRFLNTESVVEMEKAGSKLSFKEFGVNDFKLFSYPEAEQKVEPVYVRNWSC